MRSVEDDAVSLLALAERANVSPFHFARQFRATVGVPPHRFVLQQRIQRSLRLIKAGRLPLAQIAVEAGFHDQPHFTRAFRKVLDTTPRQLQMTGGSISVPHHGRVEQRNFDGFTPPYMRDAPVAIDVHLVQSADAPTACGETPVPVIAPAVVNALFGLTGKRHRTLPLAGL